MITMPRMLAMPRGLIMPGGLVPMARLGVGRAVVFALVLAVVMAPKA